MARPEKIYTVATVSTRVSMPIAARDSFGSSVGVGAGWGPGRYRNRFRVGIILPGETLDPIGEVRRRLTKAAKSEQFAQFDIDVQGADIEVVPSPEPPPPDFRPSPAPRRRFMPSQAK